MPGRHGAGICPAICQPRSLHAYHCHLNSSRYRSPIGFTVWPFRRLQPRCIFHLVRLSAVSDRLVVQVRSAGTLHVSMQFAAVTLCSGSRGYFFTRPSRPALDADSVTHNVITKVAWSPDSEYGYPVPSWSHVSFVCANRDRDRSSPSAPSGHLTVVISCVSLSFYISNGG